NVIAIAVPPIRERREDIPELAIHFLRIYGARSGKSDLQIDDEALLTLKAFTWPGNIRQLENVMERAVVVAEGPAITIEDLPVEILYPADLFEEQPSNINDEFDNDSRGMRTLLQPARLDRQLRDKGERE